MILVTGASGFLGKHLLQLLDQQSESVIALYNSHPPADKYTNISWQQVDLLDTDAVTAIVAQVNKIYHCAAIVSFDSRHKQQLIHDNVNMTANLVNAAIDAEIERFIYVSSIASLGRPENVQSFISEETHWVESKQNSTYAISKYNAEMEVWRGFAEGLTGAIVNPGIILGEGDFSKGSAQLMSNVAKGFPYYTEGVNGFVDVKDVANAMVLLMDSDVTEERFILCAGNYSYKDIFTQMAAALQMTPPAKHAKPWMAAIVWRLDYLRSKLTGKNPLITKESARTAQAKNYYKADKINAFFPTFQYTSIEQTIFGMAQAFKKNRM